MIGIYFTCYIINPSITGAFGNSDSVSDDVPGVWGIRGDSGTLVEGSFISSPEPLGSQGELIGWP